MTLPGAPCIYYGDEIGMAGGQDPLCRAGFPEESAEWEREPYSWTADLVALRHSSPAFRDAGLSLLDTAGPAIAYERRAGDEAFAVIVNAGDEALELEVALPVPASAAEAVPLRGAASGEHSAEVDASRLRVALPGRDGLVVRLT